MQKSIRNSLALAAALAIVFACACAVALPTNAHAACAYGQLCGKYESGNDPYAADDSDPYGGNVFGAYQMSSGNAVAYAEWLKTKYATSNTTYVSYGKKLLKAYKKDGNKCTTNFAKAWAAIFPNAKSAYLKTQYTFVKKNYYTPAAKAWKKACSGFKAANYTYALRNVIFSTAVQHGVTGSTTIFELAMDDLGGYKTSLSEKKIINAIYAERSQYEKYKTLKTRVQSSNSSAVVYKIKETDYASSVKYGLISSTEAAKLKGKSLSHFYSNPGNVQVGVYIRLGINEKKDALKLLTKYAAQACKHTKTTGGTVTYSKITEVSHVEKHTAVVCSSCGKTVKAAYKETVANTFTVYSGKKWKDVCGISNTVHEKGYYLVKVSSLNLRSKASTSGKVRAVLTKKQVVKITKIAAGSDNYWWGKMTVNGKTGWVQMQWLSHMGTASSVHKYKDGVCIYCGATKAQIARKTTGTYKVTQKTKCYKAAYVKSGKKATLAKGKKVKVVKVVKNLYNDYWGKLSTGGYIKMTLLK